jgi:translation initiation factor 1
MNDKSTKDLKDLKSLFPGMEPYIPDPQDTSSPPDAEPLIKDQEKAQMKLYVSRDKKQRGGKQVTLIQGHTGPTEVMQEMLSKLKSLCATGGSLKDGEIILQGDHVKKVIAWLQKAGYKQVKQKGG